MTDKNTEALLLEQIALLRTGYLARLPLELSAVNELACALSGSKSDRDKLDELHHRLHKLAGSGGTFGLSALSVRARTLEQQVKVLRANGMDGVVGQARDDLVAGIAALGDTVADVEIPKSFKRSHSVETASGQAVSVWLVEDDAMLGQELVRQLTSFNYQVRHFLRIDEAELAAKTQQPDMLIMDVMFEREEENATKVLGMRPNLRKLDCPLLFISSCDDFASRVRAAQLGARAYMLKPLDVPRLVNRMVQILEQRSAPPPRVLIVDDDVDLAAHYRLALMGAGMEAEVLHQPVDIMETLASFRPELVLMDMNMPDFSGPDLAGVIRQYEKWASLTIVYLSAETDLDRQIEAMDKGADDFITKPISDSRLVAAVHVRIERARQLEGQISKDSLTGLLKHASIKEAIELEVIRSRRSSKPATVVMLDIDHFKRVNDSYGHAAGDVVISSVAMLLRQRLRQSDIVGRYGGEEFAVVLPECEASVAFSLLDDLRQRFAAIRFSHEGKEFGCTLSAGLANTAQYPGLNGAGLLVAADEALYAAKREGRNQVRIAPVERMQEGKQS